MKLALVTGASGFLGSSVADELLREGWQVRTIVRTKPRDGLHWPAACDALRGDLRRVEDVRAAMQGVDAVFHLAAEYSLARHRAERMERDNVATTANVLDAARRADVPLVHTSSVATIGLPGDGGLGDEDAPLPEAQIVGGYKRSKVASEAVALAAAASGQHVVVVNPTAPVGPGDHRPTPTGRLVRDAAFGRMPAVVDTGLNVVSAADVAIGHRLALEKGASGRRYILGGDNLTLNFIVSVAAQAVGRRPPALVIPHSASIILSAVDEVIEGRLLRREPRAPLDGALMARKRMWVSTERAARELGFRASPGHEALTDAARWYAGARSVTREAA